MFDLIVVYSVMILIYVICAASLLFAVGAFVWWLMPEYHKDKLINDWEKEKTPS